MHSCTTVLYTTMGMKSPKSLSDKELQRYSNKRNIPQNQSYFADTMLLAYIIKQDKPKQQKNDHGQPLQAIYFNNTNPYPISWSINCRANPRTFRLRWNSLGELDSFPPRGNCPPDSLLSQDSLRTYLHPVFENTRGLDAKNDYTIYVIYNRLFNRGSRHLISAIQENASLTNGKAQIIYVNTDRIFGEVDFENE